MTIHTKPHWMVKSCQGPAGAVPSTETVGGAGRGAAVSDGMTALAVPPIETVGRGEMCATVSDGMTVGAVPPFETVGRGEMCVTVSDGMTAGGVPPAETVWGRLAAPDRGSGDERCGWG